MPVSLLSYARAVKGQDLANASDALPSVSMSASSDGKPPGKEVPWGERLRFAIEREGRTQTATEAVLMAKYPTVWKSPGFLSSWVTGRRGSHRPDPHLVNLLAKFLHVEFAWLLLGDGPMLRGGRDETAAEQAMRVCRQLGVREDAWEAAWDRNIDRAEALSVADWLDAINFEDQRLKRNKVPAPTVDPSAVAKQIAAKEETAEAIANVRRRREILEAISDAAVTNARRRTRGDGTTGAPSTP